MHAALVARFFRARLARIFEQEDAPGRIASMEGARGLAIALVFFVHYRALFIDYVPEASLTHGILVFLGNIGNSGVDLFFVLSGFLIYGAVIKKTVKFLTFMRRRVQRIYPTFLVVFALYVALSIVMPSENKIPTSLGGGALYLFENLCLLPGMFDIVPMITVAWSLSFEFFYYLFVPILVGLTRMRSWPQPVRILFFLAATALGFYAAVSLEFTQARLLMFISGILLYEARNVAPLRTRVLEKLGPNGDLGAIFGLLLTLVISYVLERQQEYVEFLPRIRELGGVYRIGTLYVGFFFFTLFCFAYDGRLRRAFSLTPLRWMGNISYSYYMIHGLALKAMQVVIVRVHAQTHADSWLAWALLLPVFFGTLLAATALYMLIERPFSLAVAGPKEKASSTHDLSPVRP